MAVLQINSGIDRCRIIAYLEDEQCLSREADGGYLTDGCVIKLETLDSPDNVLKIQRTLVIFSGEEEACRVQQKQFRMRFLSAGG